jgi:DNA primase
MHKHEVLQNVVKHCHGRLLKDEAVMAYLTDKRKITKRTINRFKLGLFPQDLRELFDVVDPKEIRDIGIIKHASQSMFKTRNLIIPVRDVYGKYIAIAGRTLLSEEERKEKGIHKYTNSRYRKTEQLFGLNFAKFKILETGVAYVVEGHFDVMTPHQHSMENIVAVCGAYLSTRQIALLSRYTNKIVLLFDNEEAAQQRALLTVRKKSRPGLEIIAKQPFTADVKDTDEFIRTYSVEKLQERLNFEGSYNDIKPHW